MAATAFSSAGCGVRQARNPKDFEACALLNAGQKAKAIDSVREAIENRIDPSDFPDEPVGNVLRQLPEFRAMPETLDRKR
jgi:hypothetical protein